MKTENQNLHCALNALIGEMIDRDWCDMTIQQLELDELSILKTLEMHLPKNVFLTIDYNIGNDSEEDEEDFLKEDSELSDYIREEEVVIKENGANQNEYSYLFGKCFMRDDATVVVRIVGDCKKNDKGNIIESIHGCTEDPMPFVFERLVYKPETYGDYMEGWNFGESMAFEAIFEEKCGIPGVDVNVQVEFEDYFRLDADGCLWSNNEEMQEWHLWEPISAKKYDKFHNAAERNLIKKMQEKPKKRTRRSRKNKEEQKDGSKDTAK